MPTTAIGVNKGSLTDPSFGCGRNDSLLAIPSDFIWFSDVQRVALSLKGTGGQVDSTRSGIVAALLQ
jgi:hypothetical protein